MSKIKDIIHKIKAGIYGAAGRVQFPDQLTEAAPVPTPAPEEPKVVEPTPEPEVVVEAAPKPVKKAATKKATPAKKPGRPKGSKSAPKN